MSAFRNISGERKLKATLQIVLSPHHMLPVPGSPLCACVCNADIVYIMDMCSAYPLHAYIWTGWAGILYKHVVRLIVCTRSHSSRIYGVVSHTWRGELKETNADVLCTGDGRGVVVW